MLSDYLQQTQRLLSDPIAAVFNTADLVSYINKAREQIAVEGQCVRVMPPISGAIQAITVLSGGLGYTSTPTVIISPPDSPSGAPPYPNGVQASAIAVMSGTSVGSVIVMASGAGYFRPSIVFTGPNFNKQATVKTTAGPLMATSVGQEVYRFIDINKIIAVPGSGISEILAVQSVSVLWGNIRYTLIHTGFSRYQAVIRNYTAYTDVPSVWTQYGQGASGTIMLFPPPSDSYPLELDCLCIPSPLLNDNDVEIIPFPWTTCVPSYAAYLAYRQVQKFNEAELAHGEYERHLKKARSGSQPRGITSWYGRF